ncbi:hypothetical protein ABZU76_35670 [Amycolatopsis sp. NPDC005232]|uniref:hypothetical protein n=1 Tax=Amycolatopsis sp. NPDC005232 TaxID=3157027 RepID=UPI0033A18179
MAGAAAPRCTSSRRGTTTTAEVPPLKAVRPGLLGELAWAETEQTTRHQIGGYGTAIQDAAETEVAVMALGGGRRNPALAEEGASWVLLAQFAATTTST